MAQQTHSARLRAGDLVEVLPAREILATLDGAGSLGGLVFMSEMLAFCGQHFRVRGRAEQVVTDNVPLAPGESRVRSFRGEDVVLLEGVRCSGRDHGDCKRGCSIFWKEKWLKRVETIEGTASQGPAGLGRLASAASGKFCCQSSEILNATQSLPARQRLRVCIRNIQNSNYSALQMLGMLLTWLRWRIQQRLTGTYPRGAKTSTPDEPLALQPGERVRVKSLREIIETLDEKGKNRGLHFSPDMIQFCGAELSVRCRADNLIAEGTGEMRHLKSTVILENATCNSATFAFGGCLRDDFLYWREIWLRRVEPGEARNEQAVQPAYKTLGEIPAGTGR